MRHHKIGPKNLSRKRGASCSGQIRAKRLTDYHRKLTAKEREAEMPSVRYLDYAYIPGVEAP